MISVILFVLFYMVAAIPASIMLGHESFYFLFATQVVLYLDVFINPPEEAKWNFIQRTIYKSMSTKVNWIFNKSVWIETYIICALLGFVNWLIGNHRVFN